MNEPIIIKPSGHEHSEIQQGKKWLATTLNRFAQAVRDAIDGVENHPAAAPVESHASSGPYEPPMVYSPRHGKMIKPGRTDWDRNKVIDRIKDALSNKPQDRIWMLQHALNAAIDLLAEDQLRADGPKQAASSARSETGKPQGVQYTGPEDYARRNPLGGVAAMFEAMALRIRAGEDFYEVLRDYSLQPLQEDQRASAAPAATGGVSAAPEHSAPPAQFEAHQTQRDCKHGQLARSCEICQLERDLADAWRTEEYWKAEHLAGNDRIAALEAKLAEINEWAEGRHLESTGDVRSVLEDLLHMLEDAAKEKP